MKKLIIASILSVIVVFAICKITVKKEITASIEVDERVTILNNYFSKTPLNGYGNKFIEVADKNGLDWRLLPAISVRETSGGIHLCNNPKAHNNPFGWGSCKIGFNSFNEAIETVGYKLSNLPVYKGKTIEKKLYYYNGTVVPTYPQEVIAIMNPCTLR